MNVKPNSAGTPHALLRSAVTTNSAPSITPNISSGAMIGAERNRPTKLICMPTHAPAIVGSIDSASSQYVLRSTRFWLSATTDARLRAHRLAGEHRLQPGFHVTSKKGSTGPERSLRRLE